jgi:hypothetical protein
VAGRAVLGLGDVAKNWRSRIGEFVAIRNWDVVWIHELGVIFNFAVVAISFFFAPFDLVSPTRA